MQWLIDAAARAGIKGIESVVVRPGVGPTELWESVARVAALTPDELAAMVAPAMRLRAANLDAVDRRATRLVPERVARRYNVVPLCEDDRTIFVASADPMNLDGQQQIEFAAGRNVAYELAAPDSITRAINSAYSANLVVDTILAAVGRDARDAVRVIDDEPTPVAALDVGSEPIVKLTSVLLRDAIVEDASDIHLEPGPTGGTVRFRIDGLLRVHLLLPATILTRVVSRIKVMSRLNIADRLRPQDGRARIQVDGTTYDLRISTVPTRDAEKAVIRVLRPMTAAALDAVRIPEADVAKIRALLSNRDGIVAITGPTGSGKTTTIYSAIREIAAREVNVVTVEDPVEYEIAGITQIQVDSKRGVSFASALRSILRQDPDVIFVGEIRDLETARVAVQAAMTGHLVIATVHANDAVGAITRLRDLGVDLASIGATLRGAVAQRLVRRLCQQCAVPVTGGLTDEEERLAAQFGTRPARRAIGCAACASTGYRGRIPIVEVAMITPAIADAIASGTAVGALQRAAQAGGMRGLREAALARVVSGETTLQEIDRVLGSADSAAEPTPDIVVLPTKPSPSLPAVLLVEDDPVQRRLAHAVLESGGFDVVDAVNGRDALALFNRGRTFTLVVTDLQMEELDGAGLLRAIRSEIDPALPVIVLTGSDDGAMESALLDAGADDYIRKPIDPPRFLARIKAALRRSAPAADPANVG